VDQLVLGNAPPWAAVLLWLAVLSAGALLWPAIRRQADREHTERAADRDQLDDLAARVEEIEQYLFHDPPEDDQWPNSASNR
jgi:hypothetical protein